MKMLTNKKLAIIYKAITAAIMVLCGVTSIRSCITAVNYGYGSYKYLFVGFHPLIGGMILIVSAIFILRNITTFIEINDESIKLCRFNKTIVKLEFKDIIEVGIGESYGLRGKKKKIYFSPIKLNKEEKENLDLVQDKVIYFSHLQDKQLSFIQTKINLDLNKL